MNGILNFFLKFADVWPWDDQKQNIIKTINLLQCVVDIYIKFEGIVEKKKELIQALKNLVNDDRNDDILFDFLLLSHISEESVNEYKLSLANIFNLISEHDGCKRKLFLVKDTEIMRLTDEFKQRRQTIKARFELNVR